MEPEKIQAFISGAREKGITDADIQTYLAQDLGVAQEQYSGFFQDEKKKDDPSLVSSSSATSLELPLSTDILSTTISPTGKITLGENKDPLQQGSHPRMWTIQTAGSVAEAVNNMQGFDNSIQTQYNGGAKDKSDGIPAAQAMESSLKNVNTLEGLFTEMQSSLVDEMGNPQPFHASLRDIQYWRDASHEANLLHNARQAGYENSKDLEQVKRETNNPYVEKANHAYNFLVDAEAGTRNLFEVQEDGTVDVNFEELNNFQTIITEIDDIQKQELEKNAETLEDRGDFSQFFYDMNTGWMGIQNDAASLYYNITGNRGAVEEIQYENYLDGFRRTASLLHDGLTQEEIDKGIYNNFTEGNFDAGFAILTTDIAQTTPQLILQAAVTAGAGWGTTVASRGIMGAEFAASASGVAMRNSVAMWSGSAAMGSTVAGRTLADNYGMMSDGQRWTMAFGNAVVETLSERLFTGDMKQLLGQELKGMTRAQIREKVFKKGLFSGEMRQMAAHFAKGQGVNFLRNGAEEGFEELVAGLGSDLVESIVAGKSFDPNFAELADAFIVGFGAGSGTTFVSAAKRPRLAQAALASVGVLNQNYVELGAAKGAAVQALKEARTEAERSIAQLKIDQLAAIETQATQEELAAMDNYSDTDLEAATNAYHAARNASFTLANPAATQEQRNEATLKGKKAIQELKAIKENNTQARATAAAEQQAIANFNYGETGTVTLNENSDTQGSKLVEGLVKIAKSLGGNNVTVHSDYDAMAASTGIEKAELFGARGIYKTEDGSIHVLLPAAMENTGLHEAFHAVARNVDPNFAAKFVKAAMPSLSLLPAGLRSKYNGIMQQYKNNQRLMEEELFAEINADIASGVITQGQAGTAIGHAVMSAVRQSLSTVMPFVKIKKYPTFSEFADYTRRVGENLASGVKISDVKRPEGLDRQDVTNRSFFAQIIAPQDAYPFRSVSAGVSAVKKAVMPVITDLWNEVDGAWGYSLNTETLEPPTSGYMVSDGRNEAKFLFKNKKGEVQPFPKEDIEKAVATQVKNVGKQENAHFGGWVAVDPKDGQTYLFIDISENTADKTEALTRAYDRAELAIYGVQEGDEIKTPKNRPAARPTIDITNTPDPGETIKTPQSPPNNSLAYEGVGVPFKNLKQVVDEFYAKNGRYPKMAFWMGDQSGYGEFVTSDGKRIPLEGGMGHALNEKNRAKGVVWANNKTQNDLDGALRDAEIVAIVSGHPVKSQRFYKGTSRVLGAEFAAAVRRNAGKELSLGGDKSIIIPKFSKDADIIDVVSGVLTLIQEQGVGGQAPADVLTTLSNFQTWEEMIDNASNDEHGMHRAGVIEKFLGDFEAPAWHVNFFRALGMPSEAELSMKTRDGYLVDNNFQEGDVYLYYSVERNDDGTIMTAQGEHSTYFNDILGEPIAISNAHDNLFSFAPETQHLAEKKASGHLKTYIAQQEGLKMKNGELAIPADVDVMSLSDKEVAQLVKRAVSAVNYQFKQDPDNFSELYKVIWGGKSRLLQSEAADMEKMRVLGSQPTHLTGDAVLYGMALGETMTEKVDRMNGAFKRYQRNLSSLFDAIDLMSFVKSFYGGTVPAPLADVKQVQAEVHGHVEDAAGFFKQATLFKAVSDMIAGGMTKAEIVNKFVADGFTKGDAEVLYAKGKGYRQGLREGQIAGRKQKVAEYGQRRKEQRAKESEAAKAIRAKADAAFAENKRVNDAFIKQLVEFVKENSGMKLSLNQVTALVRTMNSAQQSVFRKGKNDVDAQTAVYTALINRMIDIVDRQASRDQVTEENAAIKRVRTAQKKLSDTLKKLPKGSRSPLVSYRNNILQLASIDPAWLSHNNVLELEAAIKTLAQTTKMVTAKKLKDGTYVVDKPYVDLLDKDGASVGKVDSRRAKIYFAELYNELNIQANDAEQAWLWDTAQNLAVGSDLTPIQVYVDLVNKKLEKEKSAAQKKLEAIADDMGLDLNNVADLEVALELMEEERKEDIEGKRDAIIEALIPTILNFAPIMGMEPHFMEMFRYTPGEVMTQAEQAELAANLRNLTSNQLRRLEFAVYDYVANGSTFGIDSITAEYTARNFGTKELAGLGMEANVTADKRGGKLRNYYYGWLETTPTFFRRIFLDNSEAQVVDYMSALGFTDLRSAAQRADAKHEGRMEWMREFISEKKMDNPYNETSLQIYAIMKQKPADMGHAEWTLALRKQFEDALTQDKRFNDKVLAERTKAVRDAFYEGNVPRNGDAIMSHLEKSQDLLDVWSYIGEHFESQMPYVKNYAENFLGQQFIEEAFYMPIAFRKGSDNETLEKKMNETQAVRKALDSYNANKLGKRAASTYERNPNAMKSEGRYIDMNFFGTIAQVDKENEVKVSTAKHIAYISEMTSEKNDAFLKSIPDADLRRDVRQKIYDYMIDSRGAVGDEMLGTTGKNLINKIRSITVLYYFGSIIDQVIKQSSPMWNTLIEARSMRAKAEFLNTIAEYIPEAVGKGNTLDPHKAQVAKAFDVQNRNVQEAVLSFTGDRPLTLEKSRFEKGMDLSTAGLRNTDKIVASASWFAYYMEYRLRFDGVKSGDFSWESEAGDISKKAGEWASQMVSKDQNISSSRDRSKWGRYTRGNAVGMLKLFGIPFIDFLMNKKLNMMMDVQKMFKEGQTKDAMASLAGTIAEIGHFQAVTWFISAPIMAGLGAALFGGDDEDKSWWSEKFSMDMFTKGMLSDMNPYLMPVAIMEDGWTSGVNLAKFLASDNREAAMKMTGGDFGKAFESWSQVEGLPNFAGTGRQDAGFLFNLFNSTSVVGSIGAQFYTSTANIASLMSDIPSYTTTTGQEKFLNRAEADKMLLMEFAKLSTMTIGATTGLQAKELTGAIKAAERETTKRAVKNENAAVDRLLEEQILNAIEKEQPLDIEFLLNNLNKQIDVDPQNAEQWLSTRKKNAQTLLKHAYTKNNENVATMRDLTKRFRTGNEMAYAITLITQDMNPTERSQFISDATIYLGIEGKTGAQKTLISMLLLFGENDVMIDGIEE